MKQLDAPLPINEARARLGLPPLEIREEVRKAEAGTVGPVNYRPVPSPGAPAEAAGRLWEPQAVAQPPKGPEPPPQPQLDPEESPEMALSFAPSRAPAYLYVIVSEAGLVKVGFSQNVRKRLAGLQGATAHMLHIHAAEPVDEMLPMEAEGEAHRRLGRYRVRGDWFNCHPEVALAVIRKVATLDD